MARKRQKWAAGDLFSIPVGSSCGLGQVISAEPEALNSVLCVYFSHLVPCDQLGLISPNIRDSISIQLTTRESLDDGSWKVIGNARPLDTFDEFPLERLRLDGFIGAKVRGSGIMDALVSAFHGLSPWDEYADPEYFTKLLRPGVAVPGAAMFSKISP
jgi:hypothetical protein